jgi:hypothetical protein
MPSNTRRNSMERKEIEWLIVQISTYEKGTIPYLCAHDQLLAEFDRLTALAYADNEVSYKELAYELLKERDEALAKAKELKVANACGAGVYEDMCDIIYALQLHLDKISEAAKPSLGFIGARMAAKALRQQGWGTIPEILEAIADYLDVGSIQARRSVNEKPNHVHSDDGGIFWEGKTEDCPICNPKMVSVDWLFERCPHSTDPLFLATRHECDECLEELLKNDTK